MIDPASVPIWLFAYGSLIWRPGFNYAERTRGFVQGWSRRFWQGSTDHRGLPGAPGRVVTVTQEASEACWGIAYRLDEGSREATLQALDERERGGYERHVVDFHCNDGPRSGSWPALMYVAGPENPNYLGPAPLASIAEQVQRAHGPSGSNREYLLELHAMLLTLQIEDDHIQQLAALLRALSAPPCEPSHADAEARPSFARY